MVKIKICGITNKRDAIDASDLGVDMLGFVFYKKSKRYVEPKIVRDIVNELPLSISKVGVFVDLDKKKVLEIAEECSLNMLQFHGEEAPDYCTEFNGIYKIVKAFRIKDSNSLKGINDYNADFYMLDAYSSREKGGTGESFDWNIIENFEFLKPIILSGGLDSSNVCQAIQKVSPYGVDVSSGVEESPGKKDLKLMGDFVRKVRKSQ